MDLSCDTVPLIKKEYACHNIFKTTVQKRESQYETKVDPERGSVKEGEEENKENLEGEKKKEGNRQRRR